MNLARSLAALGALLLPVLAEPGAAQCDSSKFTPAQASAEDVFGVAIGLWEDTAVIGAPGTAAGRGAAYVYRRDATGAWAYLAELTASDGVAGDDFGREVAISESCIVVGAPRNDSVDNLAGAVYVFEELGGAWVEVAKVVGEDTAVQDFFGEALTAHGDRFAVGVVRDDIGFDDVGSVYVFRRHGGGWTQQAKLTASDGGPSEQFGCSVAIEDGTLVVGASTVDGVETSVGAAYFYAEVGGAWVETAKVYASDADQNDHLGLAVALEGGTAAIAAPFAGPGPQNSGAVYVFRSHGPGAWVEVARVAPDPVVVDAMFAVRVDLRGGVLVANRIDFPPAPIDWVHRFVEQGGVWIESPPILVADMDPTENQICGIAAYDQGMLVGVAGDDGQGIQAGAVKVFEFAPAGALSGCPTKLSLAAGGVQTLALDAGPAHASKLYLLLGTKSGTSPGLTVGSVVLPLNPDGYFSFTLANPNHPPLGASLGVLDAQGRATITFTLPPGTNPALAGITAHHAAVVVPPLTLGPVELVSNPAPVALLP